MPTIVRASALNIAMMVSYETAKEKIIERIGNSSPMKVNIMASMVSACCTAFFSLPFDNMKTKIQKQKPDA